MEDPSYVYLHCDLLDRATLTTITLRMKSLHKKNAGTTFAKRHICEGGKSLVSNQNQ
jgi:hypothetical protein